jgi:excisionase family DNA binding protein
MDDILTLAEAGELLGVSPGTLRNQVLAGKLAARKIGKTWVTTRLEVARYRAESLGQPGRRKRVAAD